ncbi:MAG: FG-GAP repeat domain-containing protein [Candidatus Binatia bacterium]
MDALWPAHKLLYRCRAKAIIFWIAFENSGCGWRRNGDGDPDYIAAYFDPGEIFWLERPANPLKGPWPHRLVDDQIYGVHGLMVGDIDGDGKPDLITNSSLPKGSFPESLLWYKVPPRPREAAQWDRFVFADRDASGLSHYFGFGDVNGDGRKDIASAAKQGDWFAWWEAPSNPAQPWKKHEVATQQKGASHILMGDINQDGKVDFVAARGHGRGLVWHEAPSWRAREIAPALTRPHSLAIGDIDGDGDLDVVSCFNGDRIIAWFENDGRGNFTIHPIYKDQTAYDIGLIDVDRAGDLDVLVASDRSKNVVW